MYGSHVVRVYSYEVQEQANQSTVTEVSMLVTSLRVLTGRGRGILQDQEAENALHTLT